jgi:hypothetical protein
MTEIDKSTADLVDQLQAGLLDDRPDLKARAEQAVANNPAMRHGHEVVRHSIRHLDESADNAVTINNQLRLRRREVLSGNAHRPAPRRAPRLVLGAAATVVLAVAIGWFSLPALNEMPNLLSGVDREDISDLADNLDFYVWLETRGQTPGQSRNGT